MFKPRSYSLIWVHMVSYTVDSQGPMFGQITVPGDTSRILLCRIWRRQILHMHSDESLSIYSSGGPEPTKYWCWPMFQIFWICNGMCQSPGHEIPKETFSIAFEPMRTQQYWPNLKKVKSGKGNWNRRRMVLWNWDERSDDGWFEGRGGADGQWWGW